MDPSSLSKATILLPPAFLGAILLSTILTFAVSELGKAKNEAPR